MHVPCLPLPTLAAVLTHQLPSQGALVLLDSDSFDDSGNKVCSQRSSVFIRGIGGFGGDRCVSIGVLCGSMGVMSSHILITPHVQRSQGRALEASQPCS